MALVACVKFILCVTIKVLNALQYLIWTIRKKLNLKIQIFEVFIRLISQFFSSYIHYSLVMNV